MVIGGRRANGEITDFFVDDNRSSTLRRTYIAERAVVAEDEEGYVLQLFGGSIQYMEGLKERRRKLVERRQELRC